MRAWSTCEQAIWRVLETHSPYLMLPGPRKSSLRLSLMICSRSIFASRCQITRISSSARLMAMRPEHEHVMVAIKDAFAAAQRQIKDAAREMRGQVKPQ